MVALVLAARQDRLTPPPPSPAATGVDHALAAAGDWLLRHQATIRAGQWAVVGIYAALLTVPAFLPIPDRGAHLWSNLVLFAQFVFWGIWWPFVLLSMVLVGRLWCGVLCPEGALSEVASRHGRGFAVPRWLTWKGWPFVAFACTTIYGQMVSVYQYAPPALLILGGSTVAAVLVGGLYGRSKRVWCRYLCPVTGVFGLLAKLAPLHFAVDSEAWSRWPKAPGAQPAVNCAPFVPIRTMKGASACHMCGRCSGYKGAVTLRRRSPMHEVVHVAGLEPKPWESVMILVGLMGIALGAFHWSGSALFVAAKQALAEALVSAGMVWPLETVLPWWILTNYPDQNDVLTLLDGVVLVGFILGAAVAAAGTTFAFLAAAVRIAGPWSSRRLHHLAQALIPVAGCGVFLGLSALTVTMLHADGFELAFVPALRALLIGGAAAWSLLLGWRILGLARPGVLRQGLAVATFAGAAAVGAIGQGSLFWDSRMLWSSSLFWPF
jgi:polyferredoxin